MEPFEADGAAPPGSAVAPGDAREILEGSITVWETAGRTSTFENSCWYESGKVRVIVSGEKSADTTLLSAEFCKAISAFLKSMVAVRYSVPVGTSEVSANCFRRRTALDLSMDMSSGGSVLVVSPFFSSPSRIDWGMEFSMNPFKGETERGDQRRHFYQR